MPDQHELHFSVEINLTDNSDNSAVADLSEISGQKQERNETISGGTRLLVKSQCFSFCLIDRVEFLSYEDNKIKNDTESMAPGVELRVSSNPCVMTRNSAAAELWVIH